MKYYSGNTSTFQVPIKYRYLLTVSQFRDMKCGIFVESDDLCTAYEMCCDLVKDMKSE